MRPSRIACIGAAAIALAATAPAAAEAGSWTSARAATSAGQSFDPSVAADSRGRIALGFARHLDGRNRAEIRQGRLRDGVQGASTVIDSLTGNLDDVTVGLRAGAPAADIVWRRLAANAQRLFATSVRPGSTTPPRTRTELTTGPSSGYEPRWDDGADGTRRLDRKTVGRSCREVHVQQTMLQLSLPDSRIKPSVRSVLHQVARLSTGE